MPRGAARTIDWARGRIEALEMLPIGPIGWTAGFLSIVGVRHLLELRSSGFPLFPASAFYVHYVLAYLAPLLSLCLALALFSGVSLPRVLRLMLLAWGLTLLPPLVDSLLARSHDARIGYMELGETPLSTVFLHFFDPSYPLKGTTPGIRVEAVVACVLAAVYCGIRSARRRFARAAGAAAVVYVTSLFYFTLPYLFVRALRFVFPDLSLTLLIRTIGRVARPADPEVRGDQSILMYLIPLTLVLGACAYSLTRSRFPRRALAAIAQSEGTTWALCAAIGSYAGWRILEGVPHAVAAAPFDWLALIGGPAALLLGGGGLAWISSALDGEGASSESAAPGVAGLAGAALLAASVSESFAAFAAIALGAAVLARGLPEVAPWAIAVPQAAFGISTLAAFLSGYALLAGREASILLPAPLYLLMFLVGALASLGRAAPLAALVGPPRARSAAAAAPLLVLGISLAATHAGPRAAWIVVTITASAAVLVISLAVRPLAATAAGVLGAAFVLAVLLNDPAQDLAWRERALDAPNYHVRRSEEAEAAGNLGDAAGAAAEAVRRAPDLAAAHQRLGMVRYALEDYAGAITSLETAVRLAPRDAEIRGSLAAAHLKSGDAARAMDDVAKGLELDAEIPRLHFIRAQCLDALGRTADANQAWREYVALAERFPDEAPYLELARARIASGPGS
jgi:tetratricopeptide (TPR) repeat protein